MAAVVGLAWLGGRVYAAAILHTGPTLKIREAWQRTRTTGRATTASPSPARDKAPEAADETRDDGIRLSDRTSTSPRWAAVAVIVGALVLGILVGLLTRDVILGVAVGAAGLAGARKIADVVAGSTRERASR
jgi:hypothetical protein